jgi:hypothetical protein
LTGDFAPILLIWSAALFRAHLFSGPGLYLMRCYPKIAPVIRADFFGPVMQFIEPRGGSEHLPRSSAKMTELAAIQIRRGCAPKSVGNLRYDTHRLKRLPTREKTL